jgi:hypothetical protein
LSPATFFITFFALRAGFFSLDFFIAANRGKRGNYNGFSISGVQAKGRSPPGKESYFAPRRRRKRKVFFKLRPEGKKTIADNMCSFWAWRLASERGLS